MKGTEIRDIRLRLGLTQEDLAEAMGVTRQTIINNESREQASKALIEKLICFVTIQTSQDVQCMTKRMNELYQLIKEESC